MSDVARQAGVSLMTVSRVINNKEDVSEDTRQRVLEIINGLGYRPSAIARSLATQQTRTIGLVIPDVTNPFFADITRGVERLAYAQGYHVFLCNAEEDPLRELSVIQSLEEKRVDGLILCSSRLDEQRLTELLARLPATVLINRRLNVTENEPIESVILDDQHSGWLATHHLTQTGHQRIGFLAGPPNSFSGNQRRSGYLAGLEQAGISPHPGWILNCQPSVQGGAEAARQLLNEQPGLTALFCYNDLVAIGALQACHGELTSSRNECLRRVPEDLAIVGHDDIPIAAWVSPSLTTCRAPREELGAKAVEALTERLRGCPGGCIDNVLQARLIIRQSAP
jgi:LacI family transcriptional regulator